MIWSGISGEKEISRGICTLQFPQTQTRYQKRNQDYSEEFFCNINPEDTEALHAEVRNFNNELARNNIDSWDLQIIKPYLLLSE